MGNLSCSNARNKKSLVTEKKVALFHGAPASCYLVYALIFFKKSFHMWTALDMSTKLNQIALNVIWVHRKDQIITKLAMNSFTL